MPGTPGKRALVVTAIAVSATIVGAAEVDIWQRRTWEVTGGMKGPWRLVSLNALGALAYFRWGRQR